MRFDDRSVIVTGGGGGIGVTMVRRFAAEGATVVVADVDAGDAARAAAAVPRAIAETVDVTDRAQVRGLIERTQKRFGGVDVLVNNAATCSDTPFDELTENEWARDLDVSLTAAFLTSQAVLPSMARRRRGCVVNIASVNALAYFGNEAYSAAKAGLLSLTRSLAARYGVDGVRCNAVVPGTIGTPAWCQQLAASPEVVDRVRRWYPLGRVGTPDDVASAVLFLASDEASWITGAALPVDGGVLAGSVPMTADILAGHEPPTV